MCVYRKDSKCKHASKTLIYTNRCVYHEFLGAIKMLIQVLFLCNIRQILAFRELDVAIESVISRVMKFSHEKGRQGAGSPVGKSGLK